MEVVVVGGGFIGSLTAYELRKGGLEVTLVDAGKRGEATMASAGLLVQEVWPEVSAWAMKSLERYPALIQELQAASGHTIPFALEGVFVHTALQAPAPPDLELTHFGGSSGISVQGLSCQQDALAQQVERPPTEHTPFDQLDLRHRSLEPAVAPR
jgi:choline dehydrogenase-like flavoprotein